MTQTDAKDETEPRAVWYWAVIVATTLWLLGIAVLAVLTANPITINRAQILSSQLVVVANVVNVSDRGALDISVEKVLKGSGNPTDIHLQKVDSITHKDGKYIFPLYFEEGQWHVTPAPASAEVSLLAYPANDDVVKSTESLLHKPVQRPYL